MSSFRSTPAISPGGDMSPREKIHEYRNLKIIQMVICSIVFAIGIGTISLVEIPKSFSIHIHIFTWVFLAGAVLVATAVILLHLGNKNENKRILKAALVFCFLSYSWFDRCAGGFAVVRQRIVEIEKSSMTGAQTLY
ncbi:unnamed protein product [Meganyctiphanes norvegica]|uniref:Uncharacterized protein n=1 Tax=Meganyctiphanes norvegica TaxID=48144 RepID=A0AAV2SU21_MEGNR